MTTNKFTNVVQNLNQGISRQDAALRFPAQVEDAKNIIFDTALGARKRHGSFTKAFSSAVSPDFKFKMHKIERDDDEEYALIIGRQADAMFLQVFDLVNNIFATTTLTSNANAYLSQNNPQYDDYRLVTIADTTFIVNTLVNTQLTETNSVITNTRMPVALKRTSLSPLVFECDVSTFEAKSFRQQVLTARMNNETAQPPTPTAKFGLKTEKLATGSTIPITFESTEQSRMSYTAGAKEVQEAIEGNGIGERREKLDDQGVPMNVFVNEASGKLGMTRNGLGGNQNEPNQFVTFGKVICTGGPLLSEPVKINFSADAAIDRLLVTDQEGENDVDVTITRGDDQSDPAPEFLRLGLPIRDVTFFQGRLAFASDEFVSFSRTDNVFAFFQETPIAPTDADPIDLQLAANDVNIVDYCVPYRGSILVFTKSGRQFEISSNGVFTPSTATVTPATQYDIRPARPQLLGDRLYMCGARDQSSSLLEYYFSDNAVSNIAEDVSLQVTNLLPKEVIRIATCTSPQMVFVLPRTTGDDGETVVAPAGFEVSVKDGANDTDGTDFWYEGSTWSDGSAPTENDNAQITDGHVVTFNGYSPPGFAATITEQNADIVSDIYVYNTYFQGRERIQSAWSKFNFEGDAIQDIFCLEDKLFVLWKHTSPDSGTTRLKIDQINLDNEGVTSTLPSGFESTRNVTLDHMSIVNHPGSPATTISISDEIASTSYDRLVGADGTEYPITMSGNGRTVNTPAGMAQGNYLIGRRVDASIVLSEQIARTPQNQPIVNGRLSLDKVVVRHNDSGPFSITLSHRTLATTQVPNRVTRRTSTTVGDGDITVRVNAKAEDTKIEIRSNNSYEMVISGYEAHGWHNTITE